MDSKAKELLSWSASSVVPGGGITAARLFHIMRDQTVTVIIMDNRSGRDFEESHIHVPTQICISIPEEAINPGITVNQIEARLPEASREQWKRRGFVDYIILLDWFSCVTDLRLGTPLKSLKDALYKWDSTTDLHREPLVLEGGYENWLLFYHMYTTNAKVRPPRQHALNTLPQLNFCYPSLEELKPSAPPLPAQKPERELQVSPAGQQREPQTKPRNEDTICSVAGLPDGWMKFLNTVTGTYRYYHAPTNKVHLYLPGASIPQAPSPPPPLCPNTAFPRPPAQPAPAKITKPSPEVYAKMEIAKLSAAKIRNLDPVDGGMGAMLTGLCDSRTCYMNCILQCLCNIPAMAEYFTNNYYQEDINRTNILGHKGEVVEEFGVIMKAMWSGLYKCISPRDFKFTMGKVNEQFAGNEPRDARELMLCLLDGLHEDLNKGDTSKLYQWEVNDHHLDDQRAADLAWSRHKLRNESIIVALFHGQLKITVQCLTCQHKTRTFETFDHRNLPLASSNKCSLHDCLKLSSREEKLDNHNKVFCSHCKALRDSMSKWEIWKVPPILVVYLLRLTCDGRGMRKLQSNVDFPLENLDLTQYVIGPKQRLKKYNLFAVSNHYGGLDYGYYTAFCKNTIKHQWYQFQDKDVSDISTSSVKSSAACILFYSSL
ncbi:LOW QUALITY PROTEIN: ubiquitin carboxyl-terminal hydrolase 8-like [Coregonus clupeaformis]|uniref:LOW QUALITY PROTEIN: ubiquitin carboxyl-terminal hydrolase 8-like n=1 Tax=Coregonus clupeaformis TaxID=59861 RepID=UPI001E1C35F6|nr:LOW QUALITY PROTEIN: ubiquitin carboxyl-terminal hydrolase 8-like [Coregonus clupeaformis]